jgi:hypothetical protein
MFLTEDMKQSLELANSHASLQSRVAELEKALKEYDEAFTEFNPGSKTSRDRMRMAVIGARDVLTKGTQG